jgi:hypothetical protein
VNGPPVGVDTLGQVDDPWPAGDEAAGDQW